MSPLVVAARQDFVSQEARRAVALVLARPLAVQGAHRLAQHAAQAALVVSLAAYTQGPLVAAELVAAYKLEPPVAVQAVVVAYSSAAFVVAAGQVVYSTVAASAAAVEQVAYSTVAAAAAACNRVAAAQS